MPQVKSCPSCRNLVAVNEDRCPKCGYSFVSQMEMSSSSKTKDTYNIRVKVCPTCGKELAINSWKCPNCGQSFIASNAGLYTKAGCLTFIIVGVGLLLLLGIMMSIMGR